MGFLNEREMKIASDSFERMRDDVELLIIQGSNSDLSSEFEGIANELTKITDKIKVTSGEKPGLIADTAMIIKKGDMENIVYHGPPLKNEFKPFIDSIVNLSRGENGLEAGTIEELAKHKELVEILTFITPSCPFCAKAVMISNNMAIADSKIISYVVDVTSFQNLAKDYNIMSAPVTLINKKIWIEGESMEDELARWIVKAELPDYWYHYAGEMLKEGKLEKVMGMVKEDKANAPTLGQLIKYPSMNTRLGVLVILEDLFKENPDVARKAIPGLIENLEDSMPSVRGDAATALGIVGDSSIIPILEKLLNDEYDDVKEVVGDAISEINERGN